MPIRFRCVYCDKLLSIARRKAGTIINCPHCVEKLIVPTPDPADTGPEPDEGPVQGSTTEKALTGPPPPLFEALDFDAMLHTKPIRPSGEPAFDPPKPAPKSAGGFAPLYPAPPGPAAQSIPQPRVESAPPRPRGFYVSPAKATVLTLLMIALLALAFGAGWMVRRSMSVPVPKPSVPLAGAAKTAQDFFEGLMHEEQFSSAYETLDPESRAWCSEEEFIKRAKSYSKMIGFAPSDVRITANENGDDASAVAEYRGAPGTSGKHFKDSASMRRTSTGWKVILRKNFAATIDEASAKP
jgi:phage FluMu protein Com